MKLSFILLSPFSCLHSPVDSYLDTWIGTSQNVSAAMPFLP